MNKQTFVAYYNGQCYTKAYGRKFYKKAVELGNICDTQGNMISEKMVVSLTKEFQKLNHIMIPYNSVKIRFNAILDNGKLSYISNIEFV